MSNSSRTFYALTLDQSFVYDINKKHSLGLAINALVKPREYSEEDVWNLGESTPTSNIGSKLYYCNGEGTLTYQYNFGSRGSFLHVSGNYLYREDGQFMDYRSAVSGDEFTQSKTGKQVFSFDANSQINLPDDRSTLNFGAQYLQMNAVQNYKQQLLSPNSEFMYDEQL